MYRPPTAPAHAECALHLDQPAVSVCARCGSFMCAECSVQGREAQCPTCRTLSGAAAFPFSRERFDFGGLWQHALDAFRREWVMVSLAVVIFFGVVTAGGLVVNVVNSIVIRLMGVNADPTQPFTLVREFAVTVLLSQTVGMAINLGIQGVGVLGLYRLLLDVLLGQRADLARFFSQLSRLGRYVVTNLLLFVMVSLPVLLLLGAFVGVCVVTIGLERLEQASFESLASMFTVPLLVGFGVLLPVLLVYSAVVLPLTLFVPAELLVSDASPFEAIARVWRMASGHRLTVVGYTFVAGLVTLAGLALCCVGAVPAMGLSYLLTLTLFLALRASPEFPQADQGSAR